MIHLTAPGPRSNPHLLLASRVVFRFHLLDIYSQALGLRLSPEEKPAVVPRLERPPCEGRRLELVGFFFLLYLAPAPQSLIDRQIYEYLQDWHKLVFDFNALHSHHVMGSMIEDYPAAVPQDVNPEQQHFLSGIKCLYTLGQHRDNMIYHKIMANIMLLVTCVWWFSMVCVTKSCNSPFHSPCGRVSRTCR